MGDKDVIIGPFRRRVFAEALATLLEREPGFHVRLIDTVEEAERYLEAKEPTIVILESCEGSAPVVPRSDEVSVILIAQEGLDVQIALRRVDRSRLRAAIGLAAEAPHPKVVALNADAPSQPPFVLPQFRLAETSGLHATLAWLDAAFACALQELVEARGGSEGEGWMQDIHVLCQGFTRGGAIDRAEEQHRFDAMMTAPLQKRLFGMFSLDPVEIKLICLCAAPDIDQRYAQAIGLLQSNYADARPNATTLARMLGADVVGADIVALLSGNRNFARLALIRADVGSHPAPGYRLAAALYDLMLGIRRHAANRWRIETQALPAQTALKDRIGSLISAANPPLILASGDGPALADEAAAALLANGTHVLRVDCSDLEASDMTHCLQDWALQARMHDAALMLEGVDRLAPRLQARVMAGLEAGLVKVRVVIGNAGQVLHNAVVVEVPKPSISIHAHRWHTAAFDHGMELTEDASARLGGTLRLSPSDMESVIRIAAGQYNAGAGDDDPEILIRRAARRIAAGHAPNTVRRPSCVFGWDDIVLPDKTMATLKSVPGHVRHARHVLDTWNFASRLPYGRGVGALFAGPSGTGKTMCAQVIASDLGVELMQVDIAQCVSKYIGETEKNIDRCFRAAEAASAVLLFDEADALFGRRTEIKDAHDRHANVEVAYLLQRIEAYEGLVLLTTNLKANIDSAFLRRLRFICEFPMPDADDREKIWALAFPSEAICAEDVDIAFLARRLPLSGGSIQAIAVNAAYGAATDGSEAISMRHVMAATRAELIKTGMLSAERALPDVTPPLQLEGALS